MVATVVPKSEEKLITAEEFAEMVDVGRAELVKGRIVEMPPPKDRHGEVESNFSYYINMFVREHELGRVRVGESGVLIHRDPDTVRGMDVAFISNKRLAQRRDPDGYLDIAPDLIVEVLSPSDRWSQVMNKLREYFDIGVRLVWVADTEAEIVYAYRSETEIESYEKGDDLPGEEVLPGFTVPVAELFA